MENKSNLIFQKVWQDGNIIELKITANSEYANVTQSCYVENSFLEGISVIIGEYIKNYDKMCYIEFGNKEGNFTPAFSMEILPIDSRGHMQIEVDLEIEDNDARAHRCCFYITSELGLVERLGHKLSVLANQEIGCTVALNCIDYP